MLLSRAREGIGMKTALVVIDMQRQFRSSALPTMPFVKKAIAHARREGWLIVNVRFMDGEYRIQEPKLMIGLGRLLNTPDVIQVEKDDDNGGAELHEGLKSHEVERVVFCGVNATACVCRTARGYAKLNPDVDCVISEAVGNDIWYQRNKLHEIAARDAGRPNVRAEVMFGDVYFGGE